MPTMSADRAIKPPAAMAMSWRGEMVGCGGGGDGGSGGGVGGRRGVCVEGGGRGIHDAGGDDHDGDGDVGRGVVGRA